MAGYIDVLLPNETGGGEKFNEEVQNGSARIKKKWFSDGFKDERRRAE